MARAAALRAPDAPEALVRGRILEAGAALFASHGFDSVTLRQICEAAQVSKGAIYHYFSSKDDLLSAIVISSLEQLMDHVVCNGSSRPTAQARLHGFIVSQAEFFEQHTAGFRVAMSRFTPVGGSAQARIEALRREYIRTVRRLFTDGIASGEFRQVDVRAGTRMVLALLYWMARWYEPGGRSSAVEIAGGHADIMIRGIGVR